MLALLVLFLFPLVSPDENILCTSSICKNAECEELPEKCRIQNSTHSGIIFPSPTTCNCCQYCLENLNEGELCSIGSPAGAPPTEICGPGLYCKLITGEIYDGKCTRMDTDCAQAQDSYDKKRLNGALGSMELRPECDKDGHFAPYKCIPGQTCYCVDKNGDRIFGEADFIGDPSVNMQCKCSRDYAQAAKFLEKELDLHEHFRCASNGDYDVLQCIGRKCLCVDALDGAPTYPADFMVNMTDLSMDTLKCYENKINGTYYKKCEEEYFAVLEEVNEQQKENYDMIFGYVFPSCDMDGTYKPVQENQTHKLCVDKGGTPLMAVDKVNQSDLAATMDCKCARAVNLISNLEKPTCLENGNYNPIQCRRGTCRCVNNDGIQICWSSDCEVDESQKETLQEPCMNYQ